MSTASDKRSRRERAGTNELAWWERLMLSFMGPPQLGESEVREGFVPDPALDLCSKCSQPLEAHERVHTGSMTYLRCPAP